MGKVFNFDAIQDDTVDVVIGRDKYILPATLDVEEMAAMLRLVSASDELGSNDPDPEAYEKLARGMEALKGVFRIHNNASKVRKLRLTPDMAMNIFNQVYQGND